MLPSSYISLICWLIVEVEVTMNSSSATVSLSTGECTSSDGHGSNKRRRSCTKTWSPSIDGRSTSTRLPEVCSIQEHVTLWSPIPILPLTLWSILMLCYLFAEPYIWGKKPVSLAVDGRVRTPSNGIHLPVCIVVVHHMKISMSTSVIRVKFFLLVSAKVSYIYCNVECCFFWINNSFKKWILSLYCKISLSSKVYIYFVLLKDVNFSRSEIFNTLI